MYLFYSFYTCHWGTRAWWCLTKCNIEIDEVMVAVRVQRFGTILLRKLHSWSHLVAMSACDGTPSPKRGGAEKDSVSPGSLCFDSPSACQKATYESPLSRGWTEPSNPATPTPNLTLDRELAEFLGPPIPTALLSTGSSGDAAPGSSGDAPPGSSGDAAPCSSGDAATGNSGEPVLARAGSDSLGSAAEGAELPEGPEGRDPSPYPTPPSPPAPLPTAHAAGGDSLGSAVDGAEVPEPEPEGQQSEVVDLDPSQEAQEAAKEPKGMPKVKEWAHRFETWSKMEHRMVWNSYHGAIGHVLSIKVPHPFFVDASATSGDRFEVVLRPMQEISTGSNVLPNMSKRGYETWVEFEMGNSPAAPELMDTAIVAEGAPPDPVPKSYRIPERPDDMCTPDDHELIAHLQQKKRSFEAAFLKPH